LVAFGYDPFFLPTFRQCSTARLASAALPAYCEALNDSELALICLPVCRLFVLASNIWRIARSRRDAAPLSSKQFEQFGDHAGRQRKKRLRIMLELLCLAASRTTLVLGEVHQFQKVR
jgi:hypothetical protein